MRLEHGDVILSPTDLANFSACGHLTTLDLQALRGGPKKPVYADRALELLQQRGEAFEQETLLQFEEQGLTVVRIRRDDPDAEVNTIRAMQEGVDVIYQARLVMHPWRGWADFLLKVDQLSPKLGEYAYEVADTKLSTETRGHAILQIVLYSEMVAQIQGKFPERMHVIKPNGRETFRTQDFIHYVRVVKERFIRALETEPETYPEPVPHCDICAWRSHCETRRREDDHLGYIAGMGSGQAKEVRKQGIHTLADFSISTPFQPGRGAQATYDRLREQARVQRQQREAGRIVFETIPPQPEQGLCRLPEPDKGDIYLDLEGDPYIPPSGREYLFGWVDKADGIYRHIWAMDDEAEKAAFEAFMDHVRERRLLFPNLHIYHFAPYEPSAFKRLMSRYATREDEMDNLLRAGVFVDLYPVVRQSVRAGVESYSIKHLEKYYGFLRNQDLQEAGRTRAALELQLEARDPNAPDEASLEIVRAYNEDDCRSTLALHDWLETLRREQIAGGWEIPRFVMPLPEPDAAAEERSAEIRALMDRLLADVPPVREDRDPWQQARWLLANMLPWYRREQKSFWWAHFERQKATEEELLIDREALCGLQPFGDPVFEGRNRVDTYVFPDQDTDVDVDDQLQDRNNHSIGKVVFIDREDRKLKISTSTEKFNGHPTVVLRFEFYSPGAKQDALIRLAQRVADGDIEAMRHPGIDLLTRRAPVSAAVPPPGPALERLLAWVGQLEGSCVPVQGPPGAGKTYTASHAILRLVQAGQKVGITALSHRVIDNLLEAVADRFVEAGLDPQRIVQKPGGSDNEDRRWVKRVLKNGDVRAFAKFDVVAGTPFLWASYPDPVVDHLFVDEAGQLSLIDTVAISDAARNLVLLGDPRQLTQPQQGVHPEGTEVSALGQLMGDAITIPEDRGIFLDQTWRMHPSICGFVSDLYYEGRLGPREGLEQQRIEGSDGYDGAGLSFVSCSHEGNDTSSPEEVACVRSIVETLTAEGVRWYDGNGVARPLTRSDIRVITPYNRQVKLL
jgi:predicted RecB family nuclease